jgi:hypothetical protein
MIYGIGNIAETAGDRDKRWREYRGRPGSGINFEILRESSQGILEGSMILQIASPWVL